MSKIEVNEIVNQSGDNDSGIDLTTNDQIGFKIANASKWTLNSSGNLFPASTSQGIVLGATSDTSANRLTEYEEGTWTPTVNSGGITPLNCTYVKVGDFVYVSANLADITDTGTSTMVQIGGLPFTSQSASQATGSVMFRYLNAPTNYVQLTPLINGSSTTVIFYWSSGAGASWGSMGYSDVSGSDPWDMIIGIGYRATG